MSGSVFLKRLMLATDGSEHSLDAAQKVCQIAKTNKSDVVIVHVLHPYHHLVIPPRPIDIGGQIDVEDEKMIKERGKEIMNKTKKVFDDAAVRTRTRFLIGNVARAIIDEAAKEDVSLIVVGAAGHLGGGWLLGSVADKIARNATCPVLIVR